MRSGVGGYSVSSPNPPGEPAEDAAFARQCWLGWRRDRALPAFRLVLADTGDRTDDLRLAEAGRAGDL